MTLGFNFGALAGAERVGVESRAAREPVADGSLAAMVSELASGRLVGASGTSIALRRLSGGDLLLRGLLMRVSDSGVGSRASRRSMAAADLEAAAAAKSLRNVAPDVRPRSPVTSAGRIASGDALSGAGFIDSGTESDGCGSFASLRESAAT